jgi:hypothetical protein
VMKNLKKRASSHEDRFPKTLFALSRCRITKDDGSGDLLSQSQMHIDERDEVALVAQQRMRRKLRYVGSWLFVVTSCVVATHIYREDLPSVTASHNQLGLSLSKCIRHRLVVKINNKRRRHAPPDPTWRGEHTRVSPFLLSSTHLQVHKEQSTL